MDRKAFFKKACATGLCACAGMTFLNNPSLMAQDKPSENKEDWRVNFMQQRFSKLISQMDAKLSAEQNSNLLASVGRACSDFSKDKWQSYNGDIEKFLKDMEAEWAEKATFDKETQTITIIGRKNDKCFCPFAGGNNINKTFCQCSRGWQENTFEAISGKKAESKITSSILMGGDRCSFETKLI